MIRATDWNILDLDHDPTPGDPWRVKELAGRLRELGDEAERAARDVRGLAGDQAVLGWIGASGEAFREHIGRFPGQLDKVARSHHMCADALQSYGGDLDSAQAQADRALVQARPLFSQVQALHSQLASANADLSSASKGVSAAQGAATVDPTAVHQAVRSQTSAQSAVDNLNTQLSGPQAQLEALKKLARDAEHLREGAENAAKARIHDASDAGIPPDSFWHKLGDLAAKLWHGLVIVAKIVSFVGAIVLLVVGGPLWLIVAVVAAGVIILADTLYKYANGKASLLDVGLAVLACIPITKGLTTLTELREAFQAGGMLGAAAHLGGAALGAARDALTGMAGLLRSGGGKLADLLTTLRGGWVGPNGLRLGPADNALANEALALARSSEPGITQAMTGIKDATGGEFKGLDFVLKSEDSLKRKLATELLNGDSTTQEALAGLKDNIRYTFSYAPENYTSGVNNAIQHLMDQGFRPVAQDGKVSFKNFWGREGYQGINSAWVDPATGHNFEVQFHTPQSFFMKDEGTHAIYEEMRLPGLSPERVAELQELQNAKFREVFRPPGAADIRLPDPG